MLPVELEPGVMLHLPAVGASFEEPVAIELVGMRSGESPLSLETRWFDRPGEAHVLVRDQELETFDACVVRSWRGGGAPRVETAVSRGPAPEPAGQTLVCRRAEGCTLKLVALGGGRFEERRMALQPGEVVFVPASFPGLVAGDCEPLWRACDGLGPGVAAGHASEESSAPARPGGAREGGVRPAGETTRGGLGRPAGGGAATGSRRGG